MVMLSEKFKWVLPLYMKPINCQSNAPVVCSTTTAISIDFAWRNQRCFPNLLVKNRWISEFRRANPKLKCWTSFCVHYFLGYYLMQHQLLWEEIMERMSEHTGLVSSYQSLITAACTNTGGWKAAAPEQMKGSRPRADDRCPFVPRHS